MLDQLFFKKMHGLGNDFVVINNIENKIAINQLNIPLLANRHLGIGFDQLLIIENTSKADFFCRIFNADGSEAEQCGNGLRCVARFIVEEKLSAKENFNIATRAGIFPIRYRAKKIAVQMGMPTVQENLMNLQVDEHLFPVSILSLGNPHAVIRVDHLDEKTVLKWGKSLSTHPYFARGANVGFMQVMNSHQIQLRTYERGSGYTFACGSNACAAAVAGILNGWLQSPVRIDYAFGHLEITWESPTSPIVMEGPATCVYSGHFLQTDFMK